MAEKELYVVTGNGGGGKSSIASAMGEASAQDLRTLGLEIDPRENVHQMYGIPPSGGEIVEVRPGLWLQNLRPRQVVDRLVRDRVPIEAIVRRVLESPVYRHFTEGAPGLKEVATLGHALELIRGRVRGAPEIERVIVDAPASGHGISLLTAPRLVAEAIDRGPVAELTGEVSDWLSSSAVTGVVVVTVAEEMPVTESLELIDTLGSGFGRDPDAVVVNMLYPPLPSDIGTSDDALDRLWQRRRRLNERELERLTGSWRGPLDQLPLLPLDRGPGLVAALADGLGTWLAGGAP
jgi:anion-transporting  ArsA/GET3 family ATPase